MTCKCGGSAKHWDFIKGLVKIYWSQIKKGPSLGNDSPPMSLPLTAAHPHPKYSSIKRLTTELILESCPDRISLEVTSENAFRKVGHLFPFVSLWRVCAYTKRRRSNNVTNKRLLSQTGDKSWPLPTLRTTLGTFLNLSLTFCIHKMGTAL